MTLPSHTLITIGITAYNAQETIARALESASSQDWPNFEIIVVDDHSSDQTSAIIKMFQARDKRITLIEAERNEGVAAARNRIIHSAKGDFIAFFDDDDYNLPERIRMQCDAIADYEKKYNVTVLCHTARKQHYPNGDTRYEPTMGTNGDAEAPHGNVLLKRLLYGYPAPEIYGSLATCSQAARKTLYTALGGFDVTFRRCEDTEFALRAALSGAHFLGIDIPLVEQTMTLSTEKRIEEEGRFMQALFDKHKSLFPKRDLEFIKEWHVIKYDFLSGRRLKFLLGMLKISITHPAWTIRRIMWAMPTMKYNVRISRFHRHKS